MNVQVYKMTVLVRRLAYPIVIPTDLALSRDTLAVKPWAYIDIRCERC